MLDYVVTINKNFNLKYNITMNLIDAMQQKDTVTENGMTTNSSWSW